jgi:hypothetical protein
LNDHPTLKEGFMPLQTDLEISWQYIGWKDIRQLLRASVRGGGLLNVHMRDFCFYISTQALQSEASRATWISEAQTSGLSDVFIGIAVQAAENGARMICAGLDSAIDPDLPIQAPQSSGVETSKQGLGLDPAVPFQRLRSKEGSEILPGGTEPARFVICDEGDTMFPYPRDEDLVRWIVDWQRMEVIVVQVQEFCDDEWVDAGAELFGQVEEMIDRVGYAADPEF